MAKAFGAKNNVRAAGGKAMIASRPPRGLDQPGFLGRRISAVAVAMVVPF